MAAKLLTASGGGVILDAANTATDKTLTLPALDDTVLTRTTNVTSGTAVASTSGTSIDFTGIPSWVKRITVMFSAVSTNGTSLPQVQLGDSGGIETTGYVSLASGLGANSNSTTGLLISSAGNAGYVFTGSIVIMNISGTSYVSSAVLTTDSSLGNTTITAGGRKTLSDTLTQVRITTVNGTDTFDAGSINILYE